jgi:hypothetical protein
VAGFPGCDRYYWLPAPSGVIYGGNYLLPGEGHQAVITDPAHPFAPYFDEQISNLRYHAYWADERLPHFATYGRVFARSIGGAAVGVDFEVGGGHIIFLPSPDGMFSSDSRYGLAETLARCIQSYFDRPSDEPEPGWVEAYDLPGLASLREAEELAATRLAAAEAALAAAHTQREELSKYQRLLWQEGKYGLESIVRESLRVLGFDVDSNLDEPAILMANVENCFLETEGSTDAVDMAPHYRLRQRREQELQKSGRYVKGLIVVNGYRLQPPAERPTQFIDALRVAAESTRYCLITSTQLFDLVKSALSGAGESALHDIRAAILATEGEFYLPQQAQPKVF